MTKDSIDDQQSLFLAALYLTFRMRTSTTWITPATSIGCVDEPLKHLTLLKAYQNILQNRNGPLSKGILVVHGESGSGKTSLVDSLREPVSASHGYFCSGKFFQQSEGDAQEALWSRRNPTPPFSLPSPTFATSCCNPETLTVDAAPKYDKHFGPDASLLVRAISNLSPFLDDNDNDDDTHFRLFDTTNKAILTRFKIACRRFLRAMSSERHPIVLFIDDVQWMDDGSRQLIKTLLDDSELRNVLLIFAYRDEESHSLGDLFFGSKSVVDVPVQNLDVRGVEQLVSAVLASPACQMKDLADLVVSRTLGNPFHVIQFIQSIQIEELLVYDTARSVWTFDSGQIKKEMMVSETLCDLLSRRICLLDPAMQAVLKLASLIGYCFAKEVLVAVSSIELHEKQLISDHPGSTIGTFVESLLRDGNITRVHRQDEGFLPFQP
jgi:energy-coupling factor transporter ATP-binding protein EcfA2